MQALLPLAGLVSSALLCGLQARVAAQDSVPDAQAVVPDADPPEEPGWRFSVTPYGWLNGVQGRVGTGGSETEVDVGLGDAFDQVDLGLMGVFEARHRRWIGFLDAMYSSLSADQENTVETVRALLDQITLQPALGYTLVERPWGGIDGLVGARFWNFDLDIKLIEGSIESDVAAGDQSWLDATVGGRMRYSSGHRWHLLLRGDVGAGGSEFSWQVLGGGGVDVGTCCVAQAVYRHLDVDYETDDFLADISLSGPALGLQIRF